MVNASQQYSQYMGVGAQVAWLTGALAEAVNEGRVMVITIYERADHDACKGKCSSVRHALSSLAAATTCLGARERWKVLLGTRLHAYHRVHSLA